MFLRQAATLNVTHRKVQELAGRKEYYCFIIVINIGMMVFNPLNAELDLLFAGIIRSSPFSPRYQDKG